MSIDQKISVQGNHDRQMPLRAAKSRNHPCLRLYANFNLTPSLFRCRLGVRTVEPSTLYLSFISFNGEFILTAKSGER